MSIIKIIDRSLPKAEFAMVFDVGANTGSSLVQFAAWWPSAAIHAFEPVSATFANLRQTAEKYPNARCHQLALDRRTGAAKMTSELLKMNRVVDDAWKKGAVEEVLLETGDGFCSKHGIERINFLKIDTEGHDLNVLLGFSRMLFDQRIDLLQVEASLNPDNERHISLAKFSGYLEPLGYRLFYLADQIQERRQPVLRRCNPLFISQEMVAKNTTL